MANTNDGWIKMWRKLSTNKLWLEKPFSKGQAWIDLLMFATQNTHTSTKNGIKRTYEAGCVYESVMGLADRWGWSRNKVYRFIEYLRNEGMIEFQGRTSNRTSNGTVDGTQIGTPVRIVNWGFYQDKQTVDGTKIRTSNRTRNGTHPKNNIYPKNDISKEDIYAPLPFPCGVAKKPRWMTADEWEDAKYMTADDIPGVYRGAYDNVMDYLRDKKRGSLK